MIKAGCLKSLKEMASESLPTEVYWCGISHSNFLKKKKSLNTSYKEGLLAILQQRGLHLLFLKIKISVHYMSPSEYINIDCHGLKQLKSLHTDILLRGRLQLS